MSVLQELLIPRYQLTPVDYETELEYYQQERRSIEILASLQGNLLYLYDINEFNYPLYVLYLDDCKTEIITDLFFRKYFFNIISRAGIKYKFSSINRDIRSKIIELVSNCTYIKPKQSFPESNQTTDLNQPRLSALSTNSYMLEESNLTRDSILKIQQDPEYFEVENKKIQSNISRTKTKLNLVKLKTQYNYKYLDDLKFKINITSDIILKKLQDYQILTEKLTKAQRKLEKLQNISFGHNLPVENTISRTKSRSLDEIIIKQPTHTSVKSLSKIRPLSQHSQSRSQTHLLNLLNESTYAKTNLNFSTNTDSHMKRDYPLYYILLNYENNIISHIINHIIGKSSVDSQFNDSYADKLLNILYNTNDFLSYLSFVLNVEYKMKKNTIKSDYIDYLWNFFIFNYFKEYIIKYIIGPVQKFFLESSSHPNNVYFPIYLNHIDMSITAAEIEYIVEFVDHLLTSLFSSLQDLPEYFWYFFKLLYKNELLIKLKACEEVTLLHIFFGEFICPLLLKENLFCSKYNQNNLLHLLKMATYVISYLCYLRYSDFSQNNEILLYTKPLYYKLKSSLTTFASELMNFNDKSECKLPPAEKISSTQYKMLTDIMVMYQKYYYDSLSNEEKNIVFDLLNPDPL